MGFSPPSQTQDNLPLMLTLNDTTAINGNLDLLKTQGVKYDQGKQKLTDMLGPGFDLLPPEGPKAVATILDYGAKKYAPRNWELGMDWDRPFNAAIRHMFAWWSGEDNDPETGYSHLWHAATNLFFLIAYQNRGVGKDNRPRSA